MPDRGAFVIPVHDLDLAGRSVHFPITPAWLRGALEGCEPQPAGSEGQIDVHLTKTGNEVLVQGQIDAALVMPCARCLNLVEFRPHIELSLLLHPAAGANVRRTVVAGANGVGAHKAAHGTAQNARHESGVGQATSGRAGNDDRGSAGQGSSAGPGGKNDRAGRGTASEHGPGAARSAHSRSPSKASKSDDETEFDGDEADIDTYEGEEVVLDRFVREAILLESPIFPLCSEACEGIRPASDSAPHSEGAATDPRLLPLLELAKRRKLKE